MVLKMYKSVFSGMRSDVEEDYGLVDQNGCEIDYIKLAQLWKINYFEHKNIFS